MPRPAKRPGSPQGLIFAPSKRVKRNKATDSPTAVSQKKVLEQLIHRIFLLAANDPDQYPPLRTATTLSLVCRASHRWMREVVWHTVRLTSSADAVRIFKSFCAYRDLSPVGCIKNLWAASVQNGPNVSFGDSNTYLLKPSCIPVGDALSCGTELANLAVDIKLLAEGWFRDSHPAQLLLLPHLSPDVITPIDLSWPVFWPWNLTHLIIGPAWSRRLTSGMFDLKPIKHLFKLTHLCVRVHAGTTDVEGVTTWVWSLLCSTSLQHLVAYVDNTFGTKCFSGNAVWRALSAVSIRDSRLVVLTSAPSVAEEWERLLRGEKTPWTRMMDPEERKPIHGASEPVPEDWSRFHGVQGDMYWGNIEEAVDGDSDEHEHEMVADDLMAVDDDTPIPPDIAELFNWE